jgi:hypothetical protein
LLGLERARSRLGDFFKMTSTPSQIFEQAYSDLRPRTPVPDFEVRFYRFANINCTIRLRQGRIFVRLSDLLEGAPEPVLYAILHILLAKLHPRATANIPAAQPWPPRRNSSARRADANALKAPKASITILTRFLKT